MKKEPTFQEWKEIGNKAKDVRKNLNELLNLLSANLPKTLYLKKWEKADKSFGELRTYLDGIVCGKFKDMPDNEITSIFYGLDEKK